MGTARCRELKRLERDKQDEISTILKLKIMFYQYCYKPLQQQ